MVGGVEILELSEEILTRDYRGAGHAILILKDGKQSQLFYENPEHTPVAVDLSADEFFKLLADNGVYLDELNWETDEVIIGMCSCTQFCFPSPIFGKNTPELPPVHIEWI